MSLTLPGTGPLTLPASSALAASPATGERSAAIATMQKFADEFGASLAANGYQKLPNGLTMQWGTWIPHATPGSPVAVIFPVAFPVAPRSIIVSAGGNLATSTQSAWSDSHSLTGFNARTNASNTNNGQWFAIGY